MLLHRRRVVVLVTIVVLQLVTAFYVVHVRHNNIHLLRHSVQTFFTGMTASTDVSGASCNRYFGRLLENVTDFEIRHAESSPTDIKDAVSNLRIYGKCFLDNNNPQEKCSAVEDALLPFFTEQPLVFRRWDGQEHNKLQLADTARNSHKTCYWSSFKKNIKGRGIAISLGDRGVRDLINYIKVLRYLKNELPIEIFFRDDLLEENQKKLVHVARDTIKISDELVIDGFKQDLWFVDVRPRVKEEWAGRIKGFSTKWLAALFNLFEEMILMDWDVVPFIKPADFFDRDEYTKTGAFFFRDRNLPVYMTDDQVALYRSLMPGSLEGLLFRTKPVKDLNKYNTFRYQSKHVMESGLVVMRRTTHLTGLLVLMNLQFWSDTSRGVYGDKELFWLGQLIAGNEGFTFNDRDAAAVGVLEQSGPNLSICSIQLAHLNNNNEVLWVNGGLKNCKRLTAKDDFAREKHLQDTFGSVEELIKSYNKPISITGAIIPNPSRSEYLTEAGDFVKNNALGCDGYFYCATVVENKGTIVKFSRKQIKAYSTIIKVWNAPVQGV